MNVRGSSRSSPFHVVSLLELETDCGRRRFERRLEHDGDTLAVVEQWSARCELVCSDVVEEDDLYDDLCDQCLLHLSAAR